MERINFDTITPLNFKRNVFEFLKGKIMNLNPSADLNWDDFKMEIVRPENIDSKGTITLSLKEEVKVNYINPHRTVVFKYTTNISLADILRTHYRIPEVIHYDDAPSLNNYIEGGNNNRTGVSYLGRPLLPGSSTRIANVYKTKTGQHTTRSYDIETYDSLEQDSTAVAIIIEHNAIDSVDNEDTDRQDLILALLPLARTSENQLTIIGTKESTATQDFNVNGGEFMINEMSITLSEITEG